MKAFYLAPIIGTGAEQDPWRVKSVDLGGIRSFSAWIPAATDGSPLNTHAVILIDADDHTPFEKDPDHIKYDKLSDVVDIGRRLETAQVHVKDAGKIPPDLDRKNAARSIARLAADVVIDP